MRGVNILEVLFLGEIIKIEVATSFLYNISIEQHQTKYSRHHLDIDFCFHVAYILMQFILWSNNFLGF